MEKAGRQVDCELRADFRGEWDCRFFDDDWFIAGHHAASRGEALAHAETQRQALLRDGWTMAD